MLIYCVEILPHSNLKKNFKEVRFLTSLTKVFHMLICTLKLQVFKKFILKKTCSCLVALCAVHMESHLWTSTASVALAHGMSTNIMY